MSVLPPLTTFVDLLAASENAVSLVFHAYRFSRCGSHTLPQHNSGPRPKWRHESHGGDKFSFLKSGCNPSERHSLTALTCFGGLSAECFFDGFMLLVLGFAASALRLCGSCQWRGIISREGGPAASCGVG